MNRISRPVFIAVLVVIALSLAGCTKVMDAGKVEKSSKSFLKGKLLDGENVTSVKCPKDEKAKAGHTFTCTFKGDQGTTGTVKVEVTSKDGDATITLASAKISADALQKAITDNFKSQYPDQAANLDSVECTDVPSKPGETGSCTLSSKDGQRGTLPLTVDDQGTVKWDFAQVTTAK